jgi:hypothetical protein
MRLLRPALILAAILGAASASAEPVFGPASYEITDQTSYAEDFVSTSAGTYYLWIQNGDDGGGGVDSASVSLNGVQVFGPADMGDGSQTLFARKVSLLAGNNSLALTLSGEPGAFVTLLILPRGERPNVTIGRLILPYASTTNLVLDLKNGSHAGARSVRLVFYDDAGHAVASSGRLELARRASVSQAVAAFVVNGSWSQGSIEIFYCGRGPGRLFGEAATTEDATGISSIVPLQHAGARFLSPFDQGKVKDRLGRD